LEKTKPTVFLYLIIVPPEVSNGISGKFTDVHIKSYLALNLFRNVQKRQPEHHCIKR
jgi:hypothetical protein